MIYLCGVDWWNGKWDGGNKVVFFILFLQYCDFGFEFDAMGGRKFRVLLYGVDQGKMGKWNFGTFVWYKEKLGFGTWCWLRQNWKLVLWEVEWEIQLVGDLLVFVWLMIYWLQQLVYIGIRWKLYRPKKEIEFVLMLVVYIKISNTILYEQLTTFKIR